MTDSSDFLLVCVLQVTHSVASCVQKVKLNNAELNLNNAAASYDTGSCFSTVQDGTFFNSSGYAAFSQYHTRLSSLELHPWVISS